jgi:hypothetical protein
MFILPTPTLTCRGGAGSLNPGKAYSRRERIPQDAIQVKALKSSILIE